jgi:hypothetical protein
VVAVGRTVAERLRRSPGSASPSGVVAVDASDLAAAASGDVDAEADVDVDVDAGAVATVVSARAGGESVRPCGAGGPTTPTARLTEPMTIPVAVPREGVLGNAWVLPGRAASARFTGSQRPPPVGLEVAAAPTVREGGQAIPPPMPSRPAP